MRLACLALLVSSLAVVGAIAQTAPELSPAGAAAVATVQKAYDDLQARHAAMPAPTDDRTRLERLGDIDQAGRAALHRIDFRALGAEARTARQAAWVEIKAHDLSNQQALKALLPPSGWFEKSRYGQAASDGAFHIAQHAVNDPALMRDVLARMQPLLLRGEADAYAWAEMYDRVALEFDKKPQRYGTQVWCPYGAKAWSLRDLEDPAGVDARRKAIGIDEPLERYMSQFAGQPCPV